MELWRGPRHGDLERATTNLRGKNLLHCAEELPVCRVQQIHSLVNFSIVVSQAACIAYMYHKQPALCGELSKVRTECAQLHGSSPGSWPASHLTAQTPPHSQLVPTMTMSSKSPFLLRSHHGTLPARFGCVLPSFGFNLAPRRSDTCPQKALWHPP